MKRAFNIIRSGFNYLTIILAFVIMFITIFSAKTTENTAREVFGYRAYIVLTDSMAATDFDSGDVIISKKVDPAKLEVGDIITFSSPAPESFGEIITHKIRNILPSSTGALYFQTYGTTTGSIDRELVPGSHVIGKYIFAIPNAGHFFSFMKTPSGYFALILLPFSLLILYNAVFAFVYYRRYKNEEEDERKAEHEKLAEERAKLEKAKQELEAMQAQMAQNQAAAPSEPPASGE